MFEEVISKLPFDLYPNNTYLYMDDLNTDVLKDKLFHLDDLSDEGLYKLICKSLNYVVDETFMTKNIELMMYLYTNSRFLMTLTNVLSRQDVKLNYIQLVYCNRVAYDYFTARRDDKNEYIASLLLNLIMVLNRGYTPSLVGLGLSEELACRLVNARHSSLKEHIQVRRLNLEIMKQTTDIMTVQMIVDIYGKLFDRITPLFSGIMYDCYTREHFNGQEMEDIYSTINIAILEIVNNLPQDMMYQLLKRFHETYELVHLNKGIRFNIYSICKDDYPRLFYTLEVLKNEGIYLPTR